MRYVKTIRSDYILQAHQRGYSFDCQCRQASTHQPPTENCSCVSMGKAGHQSSPVSSLELLCTCLHPFLHSCPPHFLKWLAFHRLWLASSATLPILSMALFLSPPLSPRSFICVDIDIAGKSLHPTSTHPFCLPSWDFLFEQPRRLFHQLMVPWGISLPDESVLNLLVQWVHI